MQCMLLKMQCMLPKMQCTLYFLGIIIILKKENFGGNSSNMYKTETHLHTKEGSKCGRLTAEEMVVAYHNAGFHTLFISNHFGTKFFEPWGELTWDETVDRFMLGYHNARKAGKKYNMNVLFSAEVEFDELENIHYLLYGIDETFLKKYAYFMRMKVADFMEIAKSQGILVIQAHPYRDGNLITTPDLVDGFEVRNLNPRHCSYDECAEATAKEYGLYRTAGSDAHRPEDVAATAMGSENEIKTADDYIGLVKSGKAVLL